MLLYSTLYLFGYDLELEDLKNFRQLGSKTPGHPEHGQTPGVEVTSGPLGQGCATSVGMALAEAHLACHFNRSQHPVVDHRTFVLCGDGDLMEGISSEAASLAGHLGLGKLIWIWDDNRITIEGATELATSEDIEARFRAHRWHVERVADANDLAELSAAIERATEVTDRPSLVAVRSHIAFGAPGKQDSEKAHGSPLGADEIAGAKAAYGWPSSEPFFVPQQVLERCRGAVERGRTLEQAWRQAMDAFAHAHPAAAGELARRLGTLLPEGWQEHLPELPSDAPPIATRAASGKVLNAIAETLPELITGSADLGPSCKTELTAAGYMAPGDAHGRNLHYGIREHAMGAVLNGLSLHGGLRPVGSTFLVFADYMRPAIRLSALMEQPVVFVFTHDSIWVGEDGPTHQPVEQLLSLRAIPGLTVIRPADANETAAAWLVALERDDGPTAIILSRQGLPVLPCDRQGVARGGYLVADPAQPDLVLVASGSEVHLALAAAAELAEQGLLARVVSMPSWELFDAQPAPYCRSILPPALPKLAIEAGVTRGWRDYVGSDGEVVGIDRFGASAPGKLVADALGLSTHNVVARAVALVERRRQGGQQ
jgi:transketolase